MSDAICRTAGQDDPAVAPGVTLSAEPPGGWIQVASSRVLIVIGLTGVGKSTAMAALRGTGTPYSLLPNRRDLTDSAILPLYSSRPVRDRQLRFELTRQFARTHPGGMAHVVGQLSVDPATLPHPLVFDGLRGRDEVAYAAAAFPQARFLVLTAPDFVRLMRLVLRDDAFDRVARPVADGDTLPATELLTPAERFQLEGWMRLGVLDPAEVRAKLDIITAERRNYDPGAAIQALMEAAPERSCVIDTSAVPPALIGKTASRLLAA